MEKKGKLKKNILAFLTLDFNAVLRAVAMFVLLINAMFPAHYQDWASCALQRAAGGLEKRLPVGGLLGIRGSSLAPHWPDFSTEHYF